jgi:HEAT repeat protein
MRLTRPALPMVLALAIAAACEAPQSNAPQSSGRLSELPPAIRAEIDRLASDEAGKRATAAASLAEMGERAVPAIPYLIGALGDERMAIGSDAVKQVRAFALTTLTKLGGPAREALLNALKSSDFIDARDPSSISQRSAGVLWALGKMREPRAVEPLIGLLAREEATLAVRYAVEALGDIEDARAVEPLIQLLRNSSRDSYARDAAARALGVLKDARAIEPLISVFGQVVYAADVLKSMTGQRFNGRAEWISWWQQNKDRFQKN